MDDFGLSQYAAMLREAAQATLASGLIFAIAIDKDGDVHIYEKDAVTGMIGYTIIALVGCLGAEVA